MAGSEDKKKTESLDMIVLANLVFLALIVGMVIYPNYGAAQEKIRMSENIRGCEKNLISIANAVVAYRKLNNNRFPKRLDDLVGDSSKGLLPSMPRCPAAGEKGANPYCDKGFKYLNGDPGRFTIFCFGGVHAEAGFQRNQPYYDSVYGIIPLESKRNAYGLIDDPYGIKDIKI